MFMNIAEIVEFSLIPAIGLGVWWWSAALPAHVEVGKLLLWASALLLLQSLLRDVWLLAKSRRKARLNPPRVAQCMCVESMIGMSGVVMGLLLFSFGIGKSVIMERWTWSTFAMVVLVVGFVIKDYVLEAKPWRLRRDKDHVNLIVKWRK
jgi:hypothetical protein